MYTWIHTCVFIFISYMNGQVTAAQALAQLEKLKPGMDFGAVEELIHSVDVSRRGFITKAEYQVWVENLIREGSLKLNFH